MSESTPQSDAPEVSGLTHAGIAKRYRWAIAGTLFLLFFENILRVIEPYLLGRAIDGLIVRSHTDLWIFLVATLVGLVIGVLRRWYDTRVYGRIYQEQAMETVDREQDADRDVTQITARVGFVQEFTDFFETMLPAALVSVFMLIGAVVMLGLLSPLLCGATILAALLIGAVFYLSRGQITLFNRSLNDQIEREVAILQDRQRGPIEEHFRSIVRWRILLSDLEARNFGGVFLVTIVLMALAAWIMVVVEERTEGQVFAALTYVMQFTESVVILPYTYQQYIRTSEISDRLSDADDSEA